MAYDLALAAADYPDWKHARPRRTFLVCTHMRSGSTLLGEALHRAGGLGCPIEYFHAGARPSFAARWGTPDLDSYAAAVVRHRTDPTGSLGVKLFWRDVRELCAERGRGTDMPDVARTLAELFPNPTWIHLTRQDRLRQAISQMTARTSGVWRRIPGVEDGEARAIPEYDFLEIASHLGYIQECCEAWEAWFRFAGIEPLQVSYEALVSDYEGTVRALLAELGREGAVEPPRMRPHRWDHTEAFMRRFLEEGRRRALEVEPVEVPAGALVGRSAKAVGEQGVVMEAATGAYFGLDAIGTEVWRALEQPRTLEDLAAGLSRCFSVEPERCLEDVRPLVGQLLAAGLLELWPGRGAGERRAP